MEGNTNKIIWLTGASSGIGEALASELSLKDYKLIYRPGIKNSSSQLKRNALIGGKEIKGIYLKILYKAIT